MRWQSPECQSKASPQAPGFPGHPRPAVDALPMNRRPDGSRRFDLTCLAQRPAWCRVAWPQSSYQTTQHQIGSRRGGLGNLGRCRDRCHLPSLRHDSQLFIPIVKRDCPCPARIGGRLLNGQAPPGLGAIPVLHKNIMLKFIQVTAGPKAHRGLKLRDRPTRARTE